ncbi:RHS repeat-associated core domain-containing protein [Methylogaea oryzae]|uniref:RHS repeat-associated core domain-containing protein n=1 Tax=Methylogaea oryzae TaxID=1295382 RepID=UPI0009E68336|nr:RHS repeat-associated core domain-containing protein [Methylogaea oryzae]
MLDQDNQIAWTWHSAAWSGEGKDTAHGKITYNLRLPGQYYDRKTGLHYNYFRGYDPGTGRYIESDPIGLKSGLNIYAYVENSPLSFVAPSGLEQQIGYGQQTQTLRDGAPIPEGAVSMDGPGSPLGALETAVNAAAPELKLPGIVLGTIGKGALNVFRSIKACPKYPAGFRDVQNGTKKYSVNKKELLEKLKEIEPGKWSKVYKDGFDSSGNQVFVHYFKSDSGAVFDLDVKPGWSNL